MHIINFLVAIILPYISLFSKLAPPETIPAYFFSEEAAFIAGEFGAIVFYWAGFLRNYVARGKLNEREYFVGAAILLAFMCATKIIFTLPFTWITNIFAFGLGVLSLSSGQTLDKYTLIIMGVISVIILAFTTFVLIGMAWFGLQPTSYYEYFELIQMYAQEFWNYLLVYWHQMKNLIN